MLDKRFVKHCTLADCKEQRESIEAERMLTVTRLERLRNTQANNPNWEAYDKYADDMVGIDIRIEEQQAVQEELEDDLRLLQDRERVITIAAAYIKKTLKVGRTAIQLGLFEPETP